MVVIVMGDAAAGVTAIGRALAAETHWRFVNQYDSPEPATLAKARGSPSAACRERAQWLHRFCRTVATAVDRREHLVAACPVLTDSERHALRSSRRSIRFVSLQEVTRAFVADNDVVIVDVAWPMERILGVIRDEFGL